MDANAIWEAVHIERQALIDDLATLREDRWETPSLAAGWTVHDVAAHLVDNARTTPWRLMAAMARARFDLDRQNAAGVAAEKGPTPADTLDCLRGVASRRTGPPTRLGPLESRLVEEIAHGEDIRRPLGLVRRYPSASVWAAAEYLARTPGKLGGGRELTQRVTLSADDGQLRLGSGPLVEGPQLALLMVLTGRTHALDELSGPGLPLLAAALP